MKHKLEMTFEFYRVARDRKPAIKILLSSVLGLLCLGAWASITPIDETVVHTVKIVPRISADQRSNGMLKPSSTTSGKVVEVLVKESQAVKKGEVLIRLDSKEYVIRREQEKEKYERLKKDIEAKQKQLQLANSTHSTEEAELTQQLSKERLTAIRLGDERVIKIKRSAVEMRRLAQELERASRLRKQRAISQSEVDTLRSDYQKAKEDVELAKLPIPESTVVELKLQLKTLNANHKELVHRIRTETLGLQNQLATTAGEIELQEMKIAQCEVVASCDGIISACEMRPGDWIVPGELDIAVSQRGFMAESFLPSALIGNVKEGDRAVISLDGIDWLVNGSLFGNVATISPDLVQQEVVMGDGSSVLVDGYRVWMKLEANEDFRKWDSVRLGMTGSVEIRTGKKQLAIYLLEKAIGNEWIPST